MERAVAIALFDPGHSAHEVSQILTELEALIGSAGGEILESFIQKRKSADKKFLVGKGKAASIKSFCGENGIVLVLVYNQLNNIQQRNLEDFFGIKVIDRTRLILDIFALRARSVEGKLQVELAQLLYLLPRLTGRGIDLSRLGGGIGTRGPGETRLEVDRRTINKRISLIRKRLLRVRKIRQTQRKRRDLYPVPVVSLVGYTSAGKSTMFRQLSGADVEVSAKLFSTLDPLLRRVELDAEEPGYNFLLSDTVGFIQDMPRELFSAFRATLDEILEADIVVHVVDISNANWLKQQQEVLKILRELNLPEHKIITVLNKVDLIPEPGDDTGTSSQERLKISALKGTGMAELKRAIFLRYFSDYQSYSLRFDRGSFRRDSLSRWAIIREIHEEGDGLLVKVLCSREKMIEFSKRQ